MKDVVRCWIGSRSCLLARPQAGTILACAGTDGCEIISASSRDSDGVIEMIGEKPARRLNLRTLLILISPSINTLEGSTPNGIRCEYTFRIFDSITYHANECGQRIAL